MKNIFTHTSVHGNLYYNAIYDFFDGPKLFSVIDARGDYHISYWINEDDEKLSWVIFPVSKSILGKLEKKDIDIFSLLEKKESKVFYITDTYFNHKKSDTLTYIGDIKEKIVMPDIGLPISFIEQVITKEEVREITYQKENLADYSIHVDKPVKSKAKIDFKAALPSFFIVDEFYSEFLSFFKLKDKLYPVTGKPGSFILDFNSDKFSLIENVLSGLFELIKNRADLNNYIKENKIPTQALEKLFNHVIESDLIIDITNKHSDIKVIQIDKNDAEFYIKKINILNKINVTSWQVPQADTLDKIFEITENINQNGFLNRDAVELSERHILYYLEACKILGLVSPSNSVTAIGQQLSVSDQKRKLSIAAKCFENSHCGWAWIVWSKVTKLTDIDTSTAEQFLNECAPTLSNSTKIRRARTLRNWCETLKENYQEW